LTVSQDIEQKLKTKYARISQNRIDGNEDSCESNYEDLGDLNGYDGFGGDLELDAATNEYNNIPIELEGIPVTSV
jgi:hypothetical protein